MDRRKVLVLASLFCMLAGSAWAQVPGRMVLTSPDGTREVEVSPGQAIYVTCPDGTCAGGGGVAASIDLTKIGGVVLSGADVVDVPNTAFRVNCVVGCTPSTPFTDNSAFTFGTTSINITGYVFDDVAPNAVTENRAAAPRMSGNRVPYSILRDAAGNERGVNVTAANALKVDGSAVTQPISAVALPLPAGASTDANQVTEIGSLASLLTELQLKADLTETQPVSVASLPLPSGAATSALQTQPGVDIGDVTVNNGAGAAAVNVQDGGNSLTIDATSLPLPTGAATDASISSHFINAQTTLDDSLSTQALILTEMDSVLLDATTAPLGISGVYTSAAMDVASFAKVTLVAFSDKASAVSGLRLWWSNDGVNFADVSDPLSYNVAATFGTSVVSNVKGRYLKVIYTNGAVAQTVFRMHTVGHRTGIGTTDNLAVAASNALASNLKTEVSQGNFNLLSATARIDQTTPGTTNAVAVTNAFGLEATQLAGNVSLATLAGAVTTTATENPAVLVVVTPQNVPKLLSPYRCNALRKINCSVF